jgi:hypothetical protein
MTGTAEVPADEHWTKLALCAGHPEKNWWFPEDYLDADAVKAIAICRVCPVSSECLNFAITTGQGEGVWGGDSDSVSNQRFLLARLGPLIWWDA